MFASWKRLVSSLAGAWVAAFLVAWVESHKAVAGPLRGPVLRDVFAADLAVLLPFALAIGLVIGAVCVLLEPDRPQAPQEHLAALRTQPMLTRARTAALLPLAVLATFGWCVASAHVARHLLSTGTPLVAGAKLAAGLDGVRRARGRRDVRAGAAAAACRSPRARNAARASSTRCRPARSRAPW